MKIPGMSEWRANEMWEAVTFIACDGPFAPRDVIAQLVKGGWKRKTAELHWNKFMNWALANPTEFSGPCSRLEKHGAGYQLADNPEQ